MSKAIHLRRLVLHTDKPFVGNGGTLRLAVTGAFPDEMRLHNHEKDGYRYGIPVIRYLYHDGLAQLTAIEGAISLLDKIKDEIVTLRVYEQVYQVIGWDIYDRVFRFGLRQKQITYSFMSPWLGLNERNYNKYNRLGSQEKRKSLLEKVLVGNVISMSKGVGYTVPKQIEAKILDLRQVATKLKGIPMLGFLGAFSVNFEIPDYWGIGKSVSRGFGTVKRITGGGRS